jgi:alpha-1,6-mannosyltransferase
VKSRFWIALAAELALFASLNLFQDWTLEWMPVYFVACAILCGLAYLFAATEFAAINKNAVWIFWLGAIALRLLGLPQAPGNEVWRFQADGVIQRAGLNPYQVAPNDPRVAGTIPELARVPRSDEPTAFAPGAEVLFRAIPTTNRALLYKIIFGAADLIAIALLLRLLDKQTAVWFAWNPLVAYSFIGAGHFDSFLLLAIVALIFFLERFEQAPRWRFALGAAIALGIAIALRPVCIVLLIPSLFAVRRYFIALAAAIALPFLLDCAFRFPFAQNLFGDFGHVSRLNDLFWWLIEETILPNWHQQYYRYDVILLIVSALIGFLFMRNWRRGMLWSLGASLILAPVLNAWYVTWILPVATWRRAFAWHFLSVTIFAYYLFYNERLFALPWHAEPWLRGIIVLPVLFAMILMATQRHQALNAANSTPPSSPI